MARMVKLNILCVMLLVYACLCFASSTTTQPTTQPTGPSTTVAASNSPTNCKNDNCSGTPVQCLDGCKEGFYGQDCSSTCIQNCKGCKDNATCDTCKDGYFGELCVEQCNIECKTCSSSKENCKGHCKPRSYGDDCLSDCKTSCQQCVSETNCTECRTNTFNINDVTTCACTETECSNKTDSKVCLSCVQDSWYAAGSGCCKCGRNCVNRNCNELGHCVEGCLPGYYGDRCKLSCSSKDGNCSLCEGSDEKDYRCTTCLGGLYPDVDTSKCIPCSDTCTDSSTNVAKCDASTGKCKFGCEDRYLGDRCQLLCDSNCSQCEETDNRPVCMQCNTDFYLKPGDNTECLLCSEHCKTGSSSEPKCSRTEGSCTAGCEAGYHGLSCKKDCSSNCASEQGGSNPVCDRTDGECTTGCKPGYYGVRCHEECSPNCAETNQSTVVGQFETAWIAYILAGVAVLGIVCTIVIVILTKRKKRRVADGLSTSSDKHEDDEECGLYTATNMIIVDLAFGEETEKGKLCDPDPDIHPYSLIEDDREYFNTRGIPVGSLLSVLKAKGEDDYTSEFKGFSKQKWYIAAQAPNKYTLNDFWFMAWQDRVSTIVMMTNVCDQELSDGDKYWPELDASLVQGDITITGKSEHQNSVFVTRVFSVQRAGETRIVTQLQFMEWQNSTVIEVAEFHAKFRTVRAKAKDADHGSPAIVHCSFIAGIGQTGVFVSLDILYDEAMATKVVNIPDTVTSLRDQRFNMVQDIGQYVCLHKVLAQCVLLDCRPVQQTNFPARYTQLSMTQDGDISMLQGSFQSVGSTLILDDRDLDSLKRNAALTRLNRPTTDKIEDRYRPKLRIENRKMDSDYINAVYVDGYTKKDKFIMTQFPMPETLNDFYRLVEQTKSSCIVVMETVDTTDRTQVQFIPKKGSSKTFGKTVVSVREVDSQSSYDVIYMTLYKKGMLSTLRGVKEREVIVYQFKGWDNKSQLPKEESAMLELVQAVNSRDVTAERAGPIIVTCLNGSNRSGMFVLLSVAMEKLVTTQEVSMSSALRHIQSRRPGAVPNLEQYRFCHEVVTQYVTRLPSPDDLQPVQEPYK